MGTPTVHLNGARILDAVSKILLVFTASAVGWAASNIVELKVDVAAIESNRFTDAEGAALERRLATVREQMATLPTESPPPWFKQEVDGIKGELKRLSRSVAKLEGSLTAHRESHPSRDP